MIESESSRPGPDREGRLATRAGSGLLSDLREMVREQGEFLELLRAIIRRDLTLRYRNAAMGFGWAVFMPLLQMLIFTLVFTRVAPLDTGMPYPVYLRRSGRVDVHRLGLARVSDVVDVEHAPRHESVLPARGAAILAVLVSLFDFAVASAVM